MGRGGDTAQPVAALRQTGATSKTSQDNWRCAGCKTTDPSLRYRSKKGSYCYDCKNYANIKQKEHGVEFTREEFVQWKRSDPGNRLCSYCGINSDQLYALNVRNVRGKRRRHESIGVDRKDNSLPYRLDNICSSCPLCNGMKSGVLSYEEMKILGKKNRNLWEKRLDPKFESQTTKASENDVAPPAAATTNTADAIDGESGSENSDGWRCPSCQTTDTSLRHLSKKSSYCYDCSNYSNLIRKPHGVEFTKEEFLQWKRADSNNRLCSYCGINRDQLRALNIINIRSGHPYESIGVDRKDNSLPYRLDNICSCCAACNGIKSGVLSFEEMKELGETVRGMWDERLQAQQQSEK